MSAIEDLTYLATLTPGWFDPGSHKGGWGVPPDEGALATARGFVERLGDPTPHCSADPQDGSVHLYWRDEQGGTLSVYVEAGCVGLILGHTGDSRARFDPDREDVSCDEALAIVRDWLRGTG